MVGRTVLLLAASLLLVALPALAEDPFPHFAELDGNVDFWTRVFTEWDRDHVAIHDLRYPGVVYEVVRLPGRIEPRYTRAQERLLEKTRDAWSDRLERLASRVSAGEALSDDEKRLTLLLTEHGGTHALAGAADRVRSQRGIRSAFKRSIEVSRRYDARFREIFRAAGLPEDLAMLPHIESAFQENARSSVGATGMWQFTRGTGRSYLSINRAIDERLDPVASARGAAQYMSDAYTRLGSWPIALTSYNYGVAGMAQAKRKHGDFGSIYRNFKGRYFGFASSNFYAEFLATRKILAAPESYFPEGLNYRDPIDEDDVVLAQRTPPSRIAARYGVSVATLSKLNPSWSTRAVDGDLALPEGTRVWLPAGAAGVTTAAGRLDAPTARLVIEGLEEEEVTYRVRRGDNLTKIADRNGMGLEELCDLNGIDPRRPIHVGQRLRVRTGKMSGGDDVETYVVRRGDTLSTIAERAGMSLTALRSLNSLPRDASTIRVGQRLQVVAGPVHVVRRGDTLLGIAGRYGVGLSELLHLNRMRSADLIHPGQSLRIPSGS